MYKIKDGGWAFTVIFSLVQNISAHFHRFYFGAMSLYLIIKCFEILIPMLLKKKKESVQTSIHSTKNNDLDINIHNSIFIFIILALLRR